MDSEKSNRAREVIEQAFLIIKSVEFLEKQSAELMFKLEQLEHRFDTSTDFQEKERIMLEIEKYEPKLRMLIRRCEIEYENINKISGIAL